MKVYMYVYEGFAAFEAVVLGYLLKSYKHKLILVGKDRQAIHSYDGLFIQPHIAIEELDVTTADLFLIPGGNSYPALGNEVLKAKLKQLNDHGAILAAICHGPALLAEAGVVQGKHFTSNVGKNEPQFELFEGIFEKEDVVIDGNLITATGNAYVEFAFKVAEKLELFPDQSQLDSFYAFFKNKK
ncbi:DJ-1/PfpI family protein [Bacillus sp. CGMCC 1.16607]|uniref:DJ-1/PfpI family protein n=1 Tax=Bacillus sp. CGMCC 1.16607 TaxID=3351842 RepID=UPI00363BA82D